MTGPSRGAGGILFLCVANSARSQMAEAIARAALPAGVPVMSAGSAPAALNPLALRVLAEIGLDASLQRPKGVDAIDPSAVATVVTLCAEEVCPAWLRSAERLHWPLPDPAAAPGDEAARLAAFRAARDEIRRRVEALARARGPCPAGGASRGPESGVE